MIISLPHSSPPPSKLKKPGLFTEELCCVRVRINCLWRHTSVSNNENFSFSQRIFFLCAFTNCKEKWLFPSYSVLQISSCSCLLITAVKTEKSVFPLDILSSTYFLSWQLRLTLGKEITFWGQFIIFLCFIIHQKRPGKKTTIWFKATLEVNLWKKFPGAGKYFSNLGSWHISGCLSKLWD